MTLNKWETINPRVQAANLSPTYIFSMENLRFPPVPDEELRGNRYIKKNIVPVEKNSDEFGTAPKSFLWKSDVQQTNDFQANFNPKFFLKNHGHLLAESDNSTELETKLSIRRRQINGGSSQGSKVEPTQEIQISKDTFEDVRKEYFNTSYNDELTYEETLFEVHDDRIHALSATSHDDESELSSINMIKKVNPHNKPVPPLPIKKNEPITPIYDNDFPDNYRTCAHLKEPTRNIPRKKLNDSANQLIANKMKQNATSDNNRINRGTNEALTKNIIEKYIEERIKAVEQQIRDEFIRGSQKEEQPEEPSENKKKLTLLDKVPERYSIELEQADESSRDSLLKEIAAVLVAKGYLTDEGQDLDLPRELAKITRNRYPSKMTEKAHPMIRTSSTKLPDRHHSHVHHCSHKHSKIRSPILSVKNFRNSRKNKQAKFDQKPESFLELKNIDSKRKKLRSSGSRSSLTSLIRVPDTSSSSDEFSSKVSHAKRSYSSSKKSTIISNTSGRSSSYRQLRRSFNLYSNMSYNTETNDTDCIGLKDGQQNIRARDNKSSPSQSDVKNEVETKFNREVNPEMEKNQSLSDTRNGFGSKLESKEATKDELMYNQSNIDIPDGTTYAFDYMNSDPPPEPPPRKKYKNKKSNGKI